MSVSTTSEQTIISMLQNIQSADYFSFENINDNNIKMMTLIEVEGVMKLIRYYVAMVDGTDYHGIRTISYELNKEIYPEAIMLNSLWTNPIEFATRLDSVRNHGKSLLNICVFGDEVE